MSTVEWNLITQTLDPNDSYVFIDKFWKNYNKAFPLHKITIKKKNQPLDYKGDQKIIKEDTAPLWIVITNYQNYKNIRNL